MKITPAIASAIERPMHHGVYRPLGGGRGKSLSRRFADILKGRTGIWYDPQDLTTMYQDAQGTLPVYRPGTGLVDPPVGLMLDKSGGGYHASQNTTTARPTLSGRYNLLTATETLNTQSVTVAATNYTLSLSGTGTITLSGTATGTYSAGTHTITCTAGSLTLTVSGSVTRADLRATNDGVGLPPYQRVDSATTYDTAGFPLYLKFDRIDDFLLTSAVDFSGTDEMTVGVGHRKLRSTTEVVVEHGGSPAANTQAFQLTSFNQSPTVFYYRSRGTGAHNTGSINSPAFYAPRTVTLIGYNKLSLTECTLTANGATGSIGVSGASMGTFKSAPLSIGGQVGGTLLCECRIYSLCIIGSLLSTSEQAVLERYLNAKTRAY